MQANAKAITMATGSDNSTLISPISHHITATGNKLSKHHAFGNNLAVSRCSATNSIANSNAPNHST